MLIQEWAEVACIYFQEIGSGLIHMDIQTQEKDNA